MSPIRQLGFSTVMAMAVASAPAAVRTAGPFAQNSARPTNDLPNPYRTVENYFKLPDGRTWGSTSAVEIDKDGKSVWVAERCGANSCIADPATGKMSDLDPILHFNASGTLIKSFGARMMSAPHGIFVDRNGNVWVTDYQDNAPRPARGMEAAGGTVDTGRPGGRGAGPAGPQPGATLGHQVFEFSPDGRALMTLGKAGGALAPDCCFQPNDVLVAPNGDIFVSLGHTSSAPSQEIVKFAKDGKIVKRWGKKGTGPGEFDQPHALAMDSRGRLFVGDRNNNRIQIFDQDGKFLDEWRQFSRPSGIFIDRQDTIYVSDSESESVSRNHDGWKRGIRIGSAKDGSVKYLIPDPVEHATNTSAAEGVAADSQGNVYGAEVGPKDVKRYVRQ